MSRTTLFADILLPLPVKGPFTYRVPHEMNNQIKVGQRVTVQFGKKKVYAGLIKRIHHQVPKIVPKYILHVLDEKPLVNSMQFKFWEWIASYYVSAEGEVMNAALPSAFKLSSEAKVMLSPEFKLDEHILDEYEFRITEALLEKEKLTIDEISKQLGFQKVLPLLKRMLDKHMIITEEELKGGYKPKMEKVVTLADTFKEETNLQQLMNVLSNRAHKQLELLMSFISIAGIEKLGDQQINRDVLLKKSGSSAAILKALVDKEVFNISERVVSRFQIGSSEKATPIILSEVQKIAYDQTNLAFESFNVALLHGVTSGGKTEIYIKLIEKVLQQGKQVLYLLPEIALTTQIISRLKKYFGDKVGIYHSRFSNDERAEVWNNLAGREKVEAASTYKIVLGPRSAIFLPFENLGLVIVDEEHDPSFKQFDPAPRYNARDAAIYLATLHKAKVVLGTATPSIESYYNAINGKYALIELSERYGGMKMPDIKVVDLHDEKKRRMLRSHFSSVLINEITKALSDQKQAILFQNRRGFSLRIECEQCGWVPQCKYCDVTLTYHKHSELLKCHYCGYSTTLPYECAECGNNHLKMLGFGTEKVMEELSVILPDARIDRMDLDTTRSKNAFHRIISNFENRKTDILIGTQMVTKGLDFDNVQVVGILNADNMLSFPDFRAHERSYQLMEQVSGRAGRKHRQGKVIIQAWNPHHPIIKSVVKHDYVQMYKYQLAERKKFFYPPFYRLIMIKLKHKKVELLHEASNILAIELRKKFGKMLYGPEFPLVSRVRSYYIKQIMIKVARGSNYASVKDEIMKSVQEYRALGKYKSVQIQFDVDPQ